MHDENQYPTMRFLRCKKCGNIFVAGYGSEEQCPDCASRETGDYDPSTDANNIGKQDS